jgi:SAM-dependent methyltransferase
VEPLSRRAGLFVLGVVAGAVVAIEVLLTRLLSVTSWYGLAFLVLSLAMLGVTRGALDADRARREGVGVRPFVARRLTIAALAVAVAAGVGLGVPMTFGTDLTSLVSVLVVVVACTAPMVAGSSVVARLLAETDAPVATMYAVDLVAAAVGALAPLVLLGPLSAPGALLAIAVVLALLGAALANGAQKRAARGMAFALACAFGVTHWTGHGFVLKYVKGVARTDETPPIFERWNPLSHVAVSAFAPSPFPLWSSSLGSPRNHLNAMALIDGEAGTAVYAYAPGKLAQALEPLKGDAVTVAHVLRPTGTACVIGIGGGRDLESALLYGHDHVVGVEINPAMVEMLREVAKWSPIIDDPRVEIILGDGRTELARRPIPCRVLQASLVDTWAATSAGAFAHTESTLYTREAWSVFLDRVMPDGVLTFSRWYDPKRPNETSRLVALAMASLIDRGVTSPRDHVALVAAGKVATILVSPAPLTQADVESLRAWVATYKATILMAPGAAPDDALLSRLASATTLDALADAGRDWKLDTSAPTDDRPFFFQILAPSAWLDPGGIALDSNSKNGALAGNVAAAFQLVITFAAVIVVGAWLLLPTLLRSRRERDRALPGGRAGVYFGALGAGFMIAEIGLVQRMHVVLGHPTYALIVVLAGLLVATGIGSALSARVLKTRKSVAIAAAVAAVLLAVLPYAIIRPLAHATANSPFAMRLAWAGATAGVVGLVLGMLFPGGLAFTDRARAAPLALAINGATSVIGSVIAMTISVSAGIPASFLIAAACYALAAYCGPTRWLPVETAAEPAAPAEAETERARAKGSEAAA